MRERLPAIGAPRGSLGVIALVAGVAAATAGLPQAALFLAGAAVALIFGSLWHRREIQPADPGADDGDPESTEAYRLLNAMPTPLLVVAKNGRLAHANPAARRALPRLRVREPFSSALRAPEWIEAVTASLSDRQARHVSFVASPGRPRLLQARLSAVDDGAAIGAAGGLLVQIEDRTEEQRIERMRSDFVANASHELRTPLASIIGYIETLQHHAREDPEARERFLGIMAREAGRMQRLVDDLMALSRIEMIEHVRPEAPCAIFEIAAEAAAALKPVAAAAGATLKVALAPESPLVRGDRDQLYQVFSNLLDNAIKYSGRGAGVEVAAAPASGAFPNQIGISVSDTGPGIPREHLPRLTERFYRANAGQSRTMGGTGLGLAIVKHILNRHEGRLEIASQVGRGSAFTVWLPRHAGPS